MFETFTLGHIPALLVGTAMTFGGMWPMCDARGAMLEYGFPARIADTRACAPVMVMGTVRTSIIGMLVFIFYARNQLDAVDTIMALTGAYAGVVDSYLVWKEGRHGKAVFRLISCLLISAWGVAGWTAASR